MDYSYIEDIGLDKDQYDGLKRQIKSEYAEGLQYVDPKRIQYRDRIERWNKQKKETNKINIPMIANAIDILIATSYTDALTVNFASRDGWIGQEKADNLNMLYEFDNNEDDYQQVYYQKEQDRYFFGVSLRIRDNRDDTRKIPLFSIINPLCWIPDPIPSQTGRFDGKGYRYHGFEMSTSMHDMMASGLYSQEALDRLVQNYFSPENIKNVLSYVTAYNYNFPSGTSGCTHNFPLDIYHHLTNYDGKKYITTWDAGKNVCLRMKEIKAVTKEEKKDKNLIDFPVVLNYWKPRRNDPFGESVCDKLDDLQQAKTILFNLNIIKAKKEALGGDMIWNSRLIKNRNDILKPTTEGRQIFVDSTEDLSRAGYEIPRSQIKSDVFSMITAIEGEGKRNVSLDDQQAGIIASRDVTATESQIAQANANIIGLLNNKVNSRGDKQFAFEWLKGYYENLSSIDEKIITVGSANFEYKTITIEQDSIFMKQMPYVSVNTAGDYDALLLKQQAYWDKILQNYLVNMSIPEVSKLIAQRMQARAYKRTPNEINVQYPLRDDERKAISYVNMCNIGVVPKSILDNPKEYYETFWVYIQKANPSEAKDNVVAVLSMAMQKLPPVAAVPPTNDPMAQMANSSNNIVMSQAMQKPQEGVPSRQQL